MGGTEVNPVEQMLGKALTAIYERAQKRGIVASDLTHLAENHFELGDTLVRELMVPRTDMVWVERDKTLRQGLSLALRSGYSRIPVAGEDLDNIIGIAYVKDLAKRALDHHEAETTEKVEQHMRPPVFVPENKEAGDLLRDMQRDQIHLAIVIDEYGGTAGIITIEDIIEEIVGEIADEYDDGIESFTWISEVKARAKAGIHIEDLAEELKISIDEADYEGIDTIGGLMAQRLGRVPIAGSSITIDGWTITSERPIGRRRRISSVMIERVQEAETESE
jgi:CBS domain containing-hemolysin-like protein